MGLEEYMDMDSDDNSSSSSSTSEKNKSKASSNTSKLLKFETYYETDEGEIRKKGPYGFSSYDKYEDTIDGEFENDNSMIKFKMPFMVFIETEKKYSMGKRYENSHSHQTHVCLTHDVRALGKVPREVVMFACGSSEKQDCIQYLEDKHGQEFGPNTEVHLFTMFNTRYLAQYAIADECTDEWHTGSMKDIADATFFPDRLMGYREIEHEEHDIKHINHMEEW